MRKRIFSGVQPSGQLHLGNYLGALKHFARLQEDAECLYCVVDLHALTVPQDKGAVRAHTRATAAAFLACGIDPQRHIVFAQSRVSGHSELAWLLACVARLGWLNRMTQFKEKSGKHRENASLGLYAYPVLMAADVLLYRATHVPVGEDQTQHLELARDIAAKFNQDYGEDFFPLPAQVMTGAGTRIMSLRDGAKKMSKSASARSESDMGLIYLTDSADAIRRKIQKAKTDAAPLPSEPAGLAARAEARNLVGIMAALEDVDEADVLRRYGGQGFAAFKRDLADGLVATLAPMGEDITRRLADPQALDQLLEAGAARARALAAATMQKVRALMGLLG